MSFTEESSFPQIEPGLFPDNLATLGEAGVLARAIDITAHEFRESRDLYVLQRRCVVLSRLLANDVQGRATMDWIATEAELMDCGLSVGSPESFCEALANIASRGHPE